MHAPRVWSLCVVLVSVAAAAPAAAQAGALAESQFSRGLAEMLAGHFDKACPALAESHRLDPRPGRLFTLAECEAKWGRVASAAAHYKDYLALFERMTPAEQARQFGRDEISNEQLAAVTPLVPQLTLSLPPEAPDGTVVKRDGIVLEQPSLGIALPVDPGEHVATTQAPGGPMTELRFTIAQSESKEITLEVKPRPEESAAPSASSAGLLQIPVAGAPAEQGVSSRRVAAYAVGGVGVAGLIIGAITGGMAIEESRDAAQGCTDVDAGHARCSLAGKAAGDQAKQLGLTSTIAFSAGAVLIGAAAIVYLTEPPRRPQTSPSGWTLAPGPTAAGLALQKRW